MLSRSNDLVTEETVVNLHTRYANVTDLDSSFVIRGTIKIAQ
jgi:hypothetical protein